ncbi:MAG: DNA-3-methyladenine glycosylase 2 family protein [Ruminococcaceae bacterium]|nr:DNA-3-methyladenine glycosylase 2 family protein [Oscillospiraceae bacterium]
MILPTIIDSGRDYVTVGNCGNFSVYKTFDCGQAFRFDPVEGDNSVFSGIAHGRRVTFRQLGEGVIRIEGADEPDYRQTWEHYLALDEDYELADRTILGAMPNEVDRCVMTEAVRCGAGIRILRQDPFEALISFIISQNNNIPRIKKIITALCEKYGVDGAFPTAEALYNAGEEGLFALKTGFRAGYIHDACRKILSGEVSLHEIDKASFEDATEMLCRIKGVGPKVSSCVLLFGFGKTEAFPIDVWIKRSLERHFPGGFDPSPMGRYAGIAQQYLFYYERWIGGGE